MLFWKYNFKDFRYSEGRYQSLTSRVEALERKVMVKSDFRPALGQALNEVSGSIAKIPDLLKEVIYSLIYNIWHYYPL